MKFEKCYYIPNMKLERCYYIPNMKFERCYYIPNMKFETCYYIPNMNDPVDNISLHGFSDASVLAFGAYVYLKAVTCS